MRVRLILLSSLVPAGLAFAVEPAKPAAPITVAAAAPAGKPAVPTAAKPAAPATKPAAAEGDAMMGDAMMSGGKTAGFTPEQVAFFESKIQPILKEACYKCHSVEQGKSKGDLTLDTSEGLKRGGKNGEIVKPGDPANSSLIVAVSYKDSDLQMPPKGEKLSDKQIADLTEWVKMGAPDPRKAAPAVASKLSGLTAGARGHYAYQPVKKPAVPAVKNRSWCITPVDAFIMEKLEAKGMTPATDLLHTAVDNDKEMLLRRATFDVTGLAPTTGELAAFMKDTSPEAFVKVVDRLLASPQYGERWGRYWLDTARYSDTIGADRNARDRDYRFPYAWTYRDWVVTALNNDMPYDQFVMHQLAADLIPKNDTKNLAALGFITVGERFGNANDTINDRIDTVSKGFLGLTVACARCHDHMFDPIPTKDYYALHGIFASILEPEDQPTLNKPDPAKLKAFETKIASLEEADRKTYYDLLEEISANFRGKAGAYMLAAYNGRDNSNTEALQARDKIIQEDKLNAQLVNFIRGRLNGDNPVFGPFRMFMDLSDGDSNAAAKKAAEIAENKNNRFNPIIAGAFKEQHPQNLNDVVAIYEKAFMSIDSQSKDAYKAARVATDKSKALAADPAVLQLASTPLGIRPAYELSTQNLRQTVQGWPLNLQNNNRYNFAAINEAKMTDSGAPAKAMIVADRKDAHDSPVFIRGQAETRGEMVPRSFLEVLTPGGRRQAFRQGSGRLELAQCIASKSNPLTARVLVNRLWMHHFGEGFVRTPDDLGTQSEKPSHPELLDYLASYFMEEGWSMKKLHRLILLSKVYQISSRTVKAYEDIDPDNRLLWRANVRRMDFEAMRDSMLVMAGKLDKTIGGNPVNLTDEPYSHRRSVYGYIDRGNVPEVMQHFDFGDPHMPNSKRTTTIVPQQALFLMNSPFAVDVARSVIGRPEVRNAPDDIQRIYAVYRIIVQRTPRPEETKLALDFLRKEHNEQAQTLSASKDITEKAEKKVAAASKRNMEMGGMDSYSAIRNDGDYVPRKALTEWETLAQALLLSNEAAYVN